MKTQSRPTWPVTWEVRNDFHVLGRIIDHTPSPTVARATPAMITVERDSAVSGHQPSPAALKLKVHSSFTMLDLNQPSTSPDLYIPK